MKYQINSLINEARNSVLRLEASETELNQNLEFRKRVIDILIHDIRSPILFIHKLASSLRTEYSNLTVQEIHALHNEIETTSFRIYEFSSDMLQWINTSQQNFKVSATTFSLKQFFIEDCQLYFDIAKNKELSVEIKCSDDYNVILDKILFKIIIRNLLDNAIKNTIKGKISLNGYNEYKHGITQKIIISDTGVGMSLEKIFEVRQGIITRKTNDSTQIGFRIVHDLLKKLNGTVLIESSPNTGTTVTLEFPLN